MKHRTELLLMRHAKSSWGDSSLSDFDRPLNKRGFLGAPYMGRLLKEQGLLPDLVFASTAVRAQQTMEAVVQESGFTGEIISTKRLYLAEIPNYVDVLSEVPHGTSRVLIIAHNPGIADFAELLGGVPVQMCTAGLAHIACQVGELAQVTSATRGQLLAFHRPPRQFSDD
jgi:phosphohistidine phosphatase